MLELYKMGLCCYLGTAVTFLKVIGFIKLLELIWRFVWMLRRNLRDTSHLEGTYGRGSWAMVTGGTDGLGLAFAKELAKRNLNIVLIARNQVKLQSAAKEIESTNQGVKVQTVVFDFAKTI